MFDDHQESLYPSTSNYWDMPPPLGNSPEFPDRNMGFYSYGGGQSSNGPPLQAPALELRHNLRPHEFPDRNIGFYSYGGGQSSNGPPPQAPALELHYNLPPTIPVSVGFVTPSQAISIPRVRTPQFVSPASDYRSVSVTPFQTMVASIQYPNPEPARPSTTLQEIQSNSQSEPARPLTILQEIQSNSQTVRQMQRKKNGHLIVSRNVQVQSASLKKCTFSGCEKKFKRVEHLKRHERIHYPDPVRDTLQCQFCHKIFNRRDNLKSHTLLHANPKRTQKRTKYYSGAMKVYNSMYQRGQPNLG